MNEEPVLFEVRGALAFLTLNRPGKLNAINTATVKALNAAMDNAEADDRVRIIILRGAGRAFSAGFDLEEEYPEVAGGEARLEAGIQRDFNLIMRFWDASKPTLASAHGACLGGAFEILLACDLAIATEDCRLGEPEVKFGSSVMAQWLPWICGPKRTAELLLTGEDRLAPELAREYGILNQVTTAQGLEQATLELAMKVARSDPRAVRHARQAIRAGYDEAGLRAALQRGLEKSIEVERQPSAEALQFYEIVKTRGAGAAAAWLDENLNIKEVTGIDNE
jgi:enoyl-CoA hydratase